ncbi:hypothetical protein SKAU_G00348450 [Synaphobranchus kaupii]|uniref:Uncharacterized protein n=1 Tax=Synaphobranchus kaupii TaxID=118154 RepID=A0A9Q1EK08_SYNKA|nr:hypothetical protein SKAU_G00348450 [Synaphobranchus kaupii]
MLGISPMVCSRDGVQRKSAGIKSMQSSSQSLPLTHTSTDTHPAALSMDLSKYFTLSTDMSGSWPTCFASEIF